MIIVHFCVGFTFWFPKIWLFQYPYGFCNPVQINGKKISDMICNKSCKGMLSRKALRILHFSYVHSVIFYGIIVWSNTPNGMKIFRKKNYNLRKMDTCMELFKKGDFTFLFSLYIFILFYVVNKKHLFTKKWEVHNHDVRSANNFHLPISNSTELKF